MAFYEKIFIPMTDINTPDWIQIEKIVNNLVLEHVEDLDDKRFIESKKYLLATGLSDKLILKEDLYNLFDDVGNDITKLELLSKVLAL